MLTPTKWRDIPNGTTFYLDEREKDHAQYKGRDGTWYGAETPLAETVFYVEDKDTTYNGWTNWETWAVKLYQDNNEPSYRAIAELSRHWARIKMNAVEFNDVAAIAAFQRVMAPAFRQVKREWQEWRSEHQDEPRELNVNWAEITMAYIDDEVSEIEYAAKKASK